MTVLGGFVVIAFARGDAATTKQQLSQQALPSIETPEYDYREKGKMGQQLNGRRDDLRVSSEQWPTSPQDRMNRMSSRLARVADILCVAAGRQYVVMLGQTDGVAESHGNGMIVIDVGILWRLSEDALACLLAHEFGHEVLDHRPQLQQLQLQSGQAGYAQRMRNIELAADEFAGRLIARTSYSPDAYSELLRHVRSTNWESELTRQYYPHPKRMAAFKNSYDAEFQLGKCSIATSRPAANE